MRICFIGDSFVNGTGDAACLGWVGRICATARARGHDLTCYNLGVRRDTSADIAARWNDEVVRRLKPEHDGRLVFSFGVNDCYDEEGRPRLDPAQSLANARAILSSAKASFPVLFVSPLPVSQDRPRARAAALSPRLE